MNKTSALSDNAYFVIDFDSTFVQVETLETLAAISLEDNSAKGKILEKMKRITDQGMNGAITYDESLSKRLALFKATKKDTEMTAKSLKSKITLSVARNKEFFRKYKDRIYIVSGGFKEYIVPLFRPYGIEDDHILANNFVFDKKENIVGVDKTNPLAHSGGKVKAIQSLKLKGIIYVIGDGYTDFEIKKAGIADKFFVFCENIKREKVAKEADYYLPNFDEFLYLMDLPRAFSYPKHRIKVLLLENIHERAIENFSQEGYEVEALHSALSQDELKAKIGAVSILGVRTRTKITPQVLSCAPKLLCIGSFCIGTNNIDLKETNRLGIANFNAPFSNTRSVVELVIGETILLARKIIEKNKHSHQGLWDKGSTGAHEIRGKKLGIVGYGNIGSQLSVIAENLGMKVYFYDKMDKLALGTARKCATLKELLRISDVVTIHVDGRPENINLFGEKEFSAMKNGAIFLNLSRGFVVDVDALARYIKSGKIAGAAVDVFPEEPKAKGEKFSSVLQNLPNVILTPHIGGSTEEAQESIGAFVSSKIINFINSGDTTLSVNFPNLQLPEYKNNHRLIHIHQNVPGVLAKINSLLAENRINIEGQYLKTEDSIGYVITDIDKIYNKEVVAKLKSMPETIKFRILY